MRKILRSSEFLIVLVAVWLTFTANATPVEVLLQHDTDVAAGTVDWMVWAVVLGLNCLLLLLIAIPPLTRTLLVVTLLTAAPLAYFVGHHGLLLDADMIGNVVETNFAETLELLSPRLILQVLLLGALPAVAVAIYPLHQRLIGAAIATRLMAILLAVAVVGVGYGIDGKSLTAAVRNHREVRYQLVPLNLFTSGVAFARNEMAEPARFQKLGTDAVREVRADSKRIQVHVIVVGETARSQNFGLGGYARNTTPALSQLPILYFTNATSCGTATRISLPCMFSPFAADTFDAAVGRNQDNLLDIAQRAGYAVYWRDNGNSCKHVCRRVDSVDLAGGAPADKCSGEFCFDEILVDELRRMVTDIDRDSVIVLHEIGSHGPAYYQRYPDRYRKYVPDCRSADFSACTSDEIVNAYDNSILYTDHVIAEAIAVLQAQSERFDADLLYVSDHGESLGENGLYLHGVPVAFAPEQQVKVPMLYWSSAYGEDSTAQPEFSTDAVTHDHVFHTLLGLMGIKTALYRSELDIFSDAPMI